MAKEAYNKAAREKGIKRRWDDLSPSTRLKYYYKAQKDFEERTGKPAYRQVSPSTTFAEYFERQDDAFKRSWLGAKRYKAYRNGAKFGDLVKPAATCRATPADLTPPTEKPKETAASDDKTSNAQTPKIDRSTLPDFDGSPKQNAWAAEIREKELDEWEAVALSERVKRSVEPATSKRRFFYNAEAERQKELVRAEMKKRGDAVVLAELEAAAREIAAEIFANPSARDWIDLKVEQKIGLNAYAAQKIAGTPKEAAAILRRYAADAKKAKSLQNDAAQNKRQPAKTTP
ncbi:MAG: hypothetical protein IIY07_06350, partial [Thermoguttaceae bacterium]|nr:hypothetical protein [Thermoguttaceae bacterium]